MNRKREYKKRRGEERKGKERKGEERCVNNRGEKCDEIKAKMR